MSNEDFQSPAWAAQHHALSAAIHKLFADIAFAFERLHALEYDAPWNRPAPPTRCAHR